MVDFKKYGNKKKLIENLKLSWESLSLFERDKEYSPSSAIGGDYTPFINKYTSESKLARSHVNSKIYNYGKKDNQIIEIANPRSNSKSNQPPFPLLVFFHGGYWQELSLKESFFPARKLINNNIGFASVEYTLAPNASIDEIVCECKSAINWINKNASNLGFDKNKIILSGSSAGAHLAAMCSIFDGKDKKKPLGVVLVSGIYDIEPLIGTSIDKALSLDKDQALRNSPMYCNLNNFPSSVVAWGENETEQFKKQSKIFVNKLIEGKVPVRSLEIKNKNHFDVILDLADFSKPLGKELKGLLNV